MAMAADEILMEPSSSLGPIDAQMSWHGKIFSAGALLEGMEKIKKEVEDTGTLNKAYIPILQGISPGELQGAENALNFAKVLVTDWLAKYKFENWNEHSDTKKSVTPEEKKKRAEEIAEQLGNHSRWLTHARSIKIDDFEKMKLRITDYSKTPKLADAIGRYYTLLQMTFATNIYKVFETADSQIYRFSSPQVSPPQPSNVGDIANIELQCAKCNTKMIIQVNLGTEKPLQQGHLPFPANNKINCPGCGTTHDLSDARRQLEAQTKKTVVV